MEAKHFNMAAVIFLLFTIIGYFFIDKSVATYFLQHYSGEQVTTFSEHLAKMTSSKKICFLGLFLCAVSFIKLMVGQIKVHHPLVIVSAIYALSISIAFVIKGVLARYRPELFFDNGMYGFHFFSGKHILTSMPSGHAVTAFTLLFIPGVLLWGKSKVVSLIFIFCAISLALSRILTTDHYFSDVMLSFAISSFSAGYIYTRAT